jgi:FKBP-type peptidyl-prolyl cis-trans isomerase
MHRRKDPKALASSAAQRGSSEGAQPLSLPVPVHPHRPLLETVMRALFRIAFPPAAALALALTAAPIFSGAARAENTTATPAANLKITDTKVGTGAGAEPGQMLKMHYTGWLYQNGAKGKKFDSSLDHGQPFEFRIGGGQVIAGWDKGILGMKVGGKRTLIIPPDLGYGARGAGGVIPPNATLIFDVELLEIKGQI